MSLDELFDTTAILLRFPAPPAGGTAFMTGSGAMKNIALDFADELGLPLPALTPHHGGQADDAAARPTRWPRTRSTTPPSACASPG